MSDIRYIKNSSSVPGITIDSDHLDAFSRLRVSNPTGLFSTQMQYDADPLQMETGATGAGSTAWSANTRMLGLTIGPTDGVGTAYTQSYQYIPYQPGKSQLVFMTGVMGAHATGITQEFGYFDQYNGIIYRKSPSGILNLVRRSSTSGVVVEEIIPQSQWNLHKLLGADTTRITLNSLKCFIFFIDLQFLGMGRIRCGFDINGYAIYTHEFNNANNLDVPYMQYATLPVQALITADNTATATTTMNFKCASVISEGGFATDYGYQDALPLISGTAGNQAYAHIFSMEAALLFNGVTNRSTLLVESAEIYVSGNAAIHWRLVIGQAITGTTTFTSLGANSAFEYNSAGTISGGFLKTVASGFLASSNQTKSAVRYDVNLKYPISLNRAGAKRTNGRLSLVAYGLTASSALSAVLNFTEIR